MRIAYVVSEYFLWGRIGGYGSIARALAEGMARRGHAVFALVPKRTAEARRDPRRVFEVDGVTVIGLPHGYAARLDQRGLYRLPRADLFVSLDARFDSWLAMRVAPHAKHAVWLLDPMCFGDYWHRHRSDPAAAWPGEKLATRAVFAALRGFGRAAQRRADAVWSQPRELAAAARRAARVTGGVRFAPNPVEIPPAPIDKAARPLVLFLGRFDWQKQPERFLALARRLPSVDFVAAGAASEPIRDAAVRAAARGIENLTLPGVVTGAARDQLLRCAWIVCNTSLREGVPRSLQEGLAYGCALVAAVDPDRLVSRFGAVAPDGDFARGVETLLRDGAWRRLGAAGRAYIEATHETQRALDAHEKLYREILSKPSGAQRGEAERRSSG
jgi:glycosyltransferase involved in cell wall biosynthesis